VLEDVFARAGDDREIGRSRTLERELDPLTADRDVLPEGDLLLEVGIDVGRIAHHGELCAMEHCAPEANVKCRSRVGCGPEELCVLTPYGGGTRGTSDMQAYCAHTDGEAPCAERDQGTVSEPDRRAPAERSPVDALSVRLRERPQQTRTRE